MKAGPFLLGLVLSGVVSFGPLSAQVVDPENPPWIVQETGDPVTFKLKDEIVVRVTFSEPVSVSGTPPTAYPRIALDIGGVTRYAVAPSSNGVYSQAIDFTYVVQAGDEDTDGLDIVANSLALNGGTIEGSSGNDAALGHPGQPATDTRRPVDGIAPTVRFPPSSQLFWSPTGLVPVVLQFSEPVTGLTIDDFVVTNGTAAELDEITFETAGTAYDFIITPDGEGAVTVNLPANAVHDAAGNGNTAGEQWRTLVGDPATVTITPTTSNTTEGSAVGFELERSKDNGARTVQIQVSQVGSYLTGDTSFGATITATPATVQANFAAGETTLTLTLDTDDDYLEEDDGSVTLTVLEDPTEVGYLLGTPSAATAVVRDDDEQVTVTAEAAPVDPETGNSLSSSEMEEGRTIRYLVTRSRDIGEQTLDVKITQQGDFLDDRSLAGHVVPPADGIVQVSFPDGQLYTWILVRTRDDTTEEDDGSVTFTMQPRPDDPLYPAVLPAPATITVRDNDAPPTVTVTAVAAEVTEGATVTFNITRTNAPDEHQRAMDVQVEMTPTGDYLYTGGEGPFTHTVSFGKGDTSKSISWRTADDQNTEHDGAFTLQVLPPAEGDAGLYLVGTPDSATTVVHDNESPSVSVSPVAATVTEGTDAEFRISRLGSTEDDLTVGVNIFGHSKIMSDATRELVQQTESLADTRITIAAGDSEATLALGTEADRVNEGDGEIKVVIVNSPAYRISEAGALATLLVEDDDIPEVTLNWISPELTLEDNVWVGEMVEGEAIDYEVECSGGTLAPDQVPHEWDTRWRIVTRRVEELNHPIHPYNTDNTYRSPCNDQPIFSTVIHGQPNRRFVGPDNGEIRLELLPQVEEAHLGTFFCYTDEVSGTPDGLEYCPKYTIGAVKSARIKVINRNPTITVEALDDAVDEGQPARFKLTRIWAADLLSSTVSAYTTTVATSATAVGDYVSTFPASTHTFELGVTELIVEFPTARDFVPGTNGSVTLELVEQSAALQAQNIGGSYEVYDQLNGITPAGKSSKTATVVVRNTDVFPALTIAAPSAEEGNDVAFVAKLSDMHDQTVTVDWALKDGTAIAGSDYTDDSGTLTFDAGVTEQTVTVATLEDQAPESDETFTLTLANPVQVTLPAGAATAEITGTITDDDLLPVVTITPRATPVEEGQSPWFVVTREGFTDDGLDVAISVTLDGADKPDRTVRIPAGELSRAYRVHHFDNDAAGIIDPQRTEYVFVATIKASAAKYVIGTPGSATVKVLNDDKRRSLTTIGAFSPEEFAEVGDKIEAIYGNFNEGNVPTGSPVMLHSTLFGSIVASANPVAHTFPDKEFIVKREYTVTADDVAAKVINEVYYLDDGLTRSAPFTFQAYHEDAEFRYEIRNDGTVYSDADDENRGRFRLTIVRVDSSTESHTIKYYTEDAEAKAGADYTEKMGTLTFPEGKKENEAFPHQEVFISINDDLLDEPYEFFNFVVVDNDDNTQVLAQAKIGIDDNDPAVVPHFTNDHHVGPPAKTNEGWGALYGDMRVKVELHRLLGDGTTEAMTSGHDIEFTYQTLDGTATGGGRLHPCHRSRHDSGGQFAMALHRSGHRRPDRRGRRDLQDRVERWGEYQPGREGGVRDPDRRQRRRLRRVQPGDRSHLRERRRRPHRSHRHRHVEQGRLRHCGHRYHHTSRR